MRRGNAERGCMLAGCPLHFPACASRYSFLLLLPSVRPSITQRSRVIAGMRGHLRSLGDRLSPFQGDRRSELHCLLFLRCRIVFVASLRRVTACSVSRPGLHSAAVCTAAGMLAAVHVRATGFIVEHGGAGDAGDPRCPQTLCHSVTAKHHWLRSCATNAGMLSSSASFVPHCPSYSSLCSVPLTQPSSLVPLCVQMCPHTRTDTASRTRRPTLRCQTTRQRRRHHPPRHLHRSHPLLHHHPPSRPHPHPQHLYLMACRPTVRGLPWPLHRPRHRRPCRHRG